MTDYLHRKLHNLTHPMLGRILMLHRVVEQRSEGVNRELEVTPAFLEQTICDYQAQGHRFVSIDKVINTELNTRNTTPFVCLTFDDAYSDTFHTAYPILKRLNIPFAVYVTTGFIDHSAQMWWYDTTDVMSWEQIKALDDDPLCTLGAHTVSHPRLSALTVQAAHQEIEDSRRRLEAMLAHPVVHFSYPHGDYNDDVIHIVESLHFHSALRSWGGTVRKGAPLLELPRIELQMQ